MEHIFKQFTLNYFAKGKQKTTFAAFLEQEDAVLMDVRSKEKALTFPIKFALHDNVTAVNIPINEVPERMAEIPAGKPVGLFCPATIRSALPVLVLVNQVLFSQPGMLIKW